MVGVRPGKGGQQEGIGERLIKARNRHRLSLEQVAQELHIPLKQLQALEQEDYSVFSAELYARGAYTRYAKYLGIDTRDSSRAFLRSLSHVRERIPLKLHTPETFFQRLIHPRIILAAAGVFLALLVGAYIAWQVQSFWRLPALKITSPISSVVEGSGVTIEGIAEQQAQVKINGEQVLMRADARFSALLVLHKGINPVRVEVVNAAGRVRIKQLFLLRVS